MFKNEHNHDLKIYLTLLYEFDLVNMIQASFFMNVVECLKCAA